jgi:hypothetical protein
VALLCCAIGVLPAQTLQITSPADGTVVSPGQVVTVTVAASPASAFQAVVLVGGDAIGFSQVLSAPPYQFSLQIPAGTRPRRYPLTAEGTTAPGQGTNSDPITLVVERPDNPVSLSAQPAVMSFHLAGDQCPLRIVGTFPDGSLVDVDESTYIAYQSDTPGVATVDGDGHVTAVAAGTANITATYAGVSTTVPVTVRQPVTIVPSPVSLYVSQAKRFIAQLNLPPGVDPTLTWSISPQLGSIDQTGLYTAPASVASWQGVTVTATSVADPTKSASAQVWIFPPVSIGVNPSSVTMSAAQAHTFTPAVANAGTDVTWAANPTGVGTIQLSQGTDPHNPYLPIGVATYFAPAPISAAQTVTITATSVSDNSKTASAQVTLVPSVAVSVSPSTVSLNGSQSQQFAATVNYSPGGAVTWSLSPSVGAISATGLYAAPATVTYQQTVSVIATGPDIGAGTYSGTAAVTLMPQISASITVPAAVTAVAASNSEIDLSWTASAEPGGSIAGYNIFRNGAWLGFAAGTSYADLGLIAATSYTYTVAAYDTGGIASAQSSGVSASTLATGVSNLVASYNFNEGAGTVLHDSSGNGNNGTTSANGVLNVPTWSTNGKYGGALAFDGAISYVAVPNANSLNLSTGMTLEAWVNPAGVNSPGDVVASYQDDSEFRFGLFSDTVGPDAVIFTPGAGYPSWISGASVPPLPPNTWTHVATTYDGTTQQLFMNGVLLASQPRSGALATGSRPLYIGGDPVSRWYFNGMIDDLRIYNSALTQSQIQNDIVGNQAVATLTSISPASGVQGTTVPVTLTGTNFVAGSTVTVSNPGIAVSGVTVVSATEITATFTIAPSAALGAANVSVTTGGGTSGTVSFTVTNAAFSRYRAITIDHTKVANTDQSNFPFLFSGTFSYLATVANGGEVTNASGYDISFYADAAGTTPLRWEMESYDPASGTINAWILVPTLSHTANTTIYLFYGNAGITSFQGGAFGSVWDANFQAVWHLPNGGVLTANDSTANGNNAAIVGASAAAGRIGGGAEFSSASDSIAAPDSASLNITSAWTLSCWVYPTVSNAFQGLISRGGASWDYAMYLYFSGTDYLYLVSDNFGMAINLMSHPWSVNAWNHIVETVSQSGTATFYVNGQQVAVAPSAFSPRAVPLPQSDVATTTLGRNFIGTLDECRVSSSARSGDWIATEFNNQNSPGTFYSIGAETNRF